MKKPLTKAQCLACAEAIFQARVIVERYLQLPQGKLDDRLHELEMSYCKQANAPREERKAKR